MLVTGKKFSKPELSRIINGDKRLAEEVEAIPKTRLDILLVIKSKVTIVLLCKNLFRMVL